SRVFYKYDSSGTRVTDVAKKLSLSEKNALKLNENDVLIATGGAKGITFEMARGLALKTGVKLLLTGRSALPGNDEMIEHFKILDNDGIVYKYVQCDVTALSEMKKAVENTEKTMGKITAILHGAGISKLTLFENMAEEDFFQTINIKARGMYNLVNVIPLNQLKALHVISSVLGKTGMRGQTDYTLANAWIDGALSEIKNQNPEIHCASLGYSVWAETGLGQKLGAVKSLKASGINAMSTEDGVNAYLKICDGAADTSTFIVTGRLGPQIENDIFAPLTAQLPRFTSKILRYAPGIELISEISINRDSDLFLAEHVFEGTTMFPGVMAIEAMAETAAMCLVNENISVVRNIDFVKAIIIPENDSVVLRIYALADNNNSVKIVIRIEADNFQNNYVEAEFLFDKTLDIPGDIPAFINIKDNIDVNPESLFPKPLFQGKLFRRICDIKKREQLDECITKIIIPEGEKYFDDKFSKKIITNSPAARDSFLQTGLLILPEGSLPEKIGEISFCNKPVPGEKVTCRVIVKTQKSDRIISDLAVYDENGKLIEYIKDVVTKTPDRKKTTTNTRVVKPVSLKRTEEDLNILIPDAKWAITSVNHSEIINGIPEISDDEAEILVGNIPEPRKNSTLCNLVATRRAAVAFAEKCGAKINPENIDLLHDEDGKPQLKISADDATKKLFDGCDVSIADSRNSSFAFIGQVPVGIDVEPVESRDAETWRGLIHNDGYKLALNLTAQTGEAFDVSATRVWTLIEAAKKANALKRILPRFNASLGDPWLSFSYADAKGTQEYFCATVNLDNENTIPFALTISFGNKQTEISSFDSDSPMNRFNSLIEDFSEKMTQFKPLFADDPNSPDTDEHHKQFCAVVDNLINQLIIIGEKVEPEKLYQMRSVLINHITPFLDESDVFRHAIDKPFGYAGDFLMLDKLVQETSQSRGIAYHFDRSQLEYPASVACRNRIQWV
ncbi:SDR family NAD(P)-dependent oxidoreductase, partial [bacterium]|nr:SDR family NAD(P)-dependent oxidoreductase [bacterium]